MGALYLVRHGQASFGSGDYDRLSELGHVQGRLVGEDLAARGIRPDLVIHGGLRRQRETAEALVAGAGWAADAGTATGTGSAPAVESDRRWAEYDADEVLSAARDAGMVTGQGTLDHAGDSDEAKREFQRQLDAALGHWAGLDAFDSYRTDVEAALADVAERTGSGRTTVVVSSAGTVSLAVAGLLADPEGVVGVWARLQRVTVNTGIARVVVGRGGLTCVAVNEHQHLERAAGPDDPRRYVTLR